MIADRGSSYDDLVQALRQAGDETRLSAEERYHANEADCTLFADCISALRMTRQWLERIGEGASKKGLIDALSRTKVRSWFTESLKAIAADKPMETDNELLGVIANRKPKIYHEHSVLTAPRSRRTGMNVGDFWR